MRSEIEQIEHDFETWALGLERCLWGIHDCPFEALEAINYQRDYRGNLPTEEHERQASMLREFCEMIAACS